LETARQGGAGVGEQAAAEVSALLQQLPSLAGRECQVEPLAGGLTNSNYKVTTADGRYVVRIASATGGLLSIDRVNEYENTLAAAEVGVGAPVIDYLPKPCVMVVGFIDGVTLSAEDLRRGDRLGRVAAACRQLHSARRFRDDFNMFATQAGYVGLVQERGFRLPPGYLDFAPQVERMRAAMAVHPEPAVPCNNDLLAENFIDDGERLWLIDYEYSGNNEPSFELGNIWSESNLSVEQLSELVEAYYGEPLRNKVARARLWGLMSKYGWTLWASIQDGVADIDFDYWQWGMEKYDRAVAEFTGPDFDDLLNDVQRDD
jgi:thiamine kinase-like enzyme